MPQLTGAHKLRAQAQREMHPNISCGRLALHRL